MPRDNLYRKSELTFLCIIIKNFLSMKNHLLFKFKPLQPTERERYA